jgi:acyl-CoA synthetase (AMP-forming)/AMP-acid ligase II/acyl carrier protein
MKQTVHSLLAQSLRRHADREAIVAPGRRPLSYADLGRQLEDDRAFLRRAGFGARSRIGVAMPPGPEGLAVIAAVSASAACAPLEPELDQGTLERLAKAMQIEALVVAEGSTSSAARAARTLGMPLIEVAVPADSPAGAHALRTDARRAPAPPDLPGPDDLAFVWHTSGTTGVPKIVAYEQWRICFDVRKRIERRRIDSSDRCLVTSTPGSAATARLAVLTNLAAGAAAIHPGDLKAESVLAAIESLAPTYFLAAPALHSRLLELVEKRGRPPTHRLRAVYSSFAEQPPQVRSRLERALGVPMVVVYGMTEVGGIAETPVPSETAPPRSVGRPHVEVAIADDRGGFLAAGHEGEVWVRGPEVIEAYESPPEANREAFRDGWFRTGDCGFLDERGFLHLTGRIKDIINRGGVKVSPAEVEFALESHPAVREAAVFARRHPTLGEDVCAAVVFDDGRSASEADLRRFLRQRLSAQKVPTRIVTAPALPRNPAGKLQRTELPAFGEALLEQSRQPPQGPQEEQVAGIFRRLLRVDDIGRHDHFFDRGGDSLRAVELLEQVKERFKVSLSMDTVLENASVAGLAKVISESGGVAGEPTSGST